MQLTPKLWARFFKHGIQFPSILEDPNRRKTQSVTMSGIAIVSVLVLAVLGGSGVHSKMPPELSRFLQLEAQDEPGSPADQIEAARIRLGLGDINQYLPAPIEKVECHVEFQVTERVPGRCTKLAGSIPACQAEKYIGINYNECS